LSRWNIPFSLMTKIRINISITWQKIRPQGIRKNTYKYADPMKLQKNNIYQEYMAKGWYIKNNIATWKDEMFHMRVGRKSWGGDGSLKFVAVLYKWHWRVEIDQTLTCKLPTRSKGKAMIVILIGSYSYHILKE
jgi:hypothetical protein